jgi:Flp pilus assembly protein TadG
MNSKARLRRRDDRGAAAVEFALISIPLFVLVMGIIQFGLAYHAQTTVTQAARTGARLAAICGASCSTPVQTATQNAAPGISIDPSKISIQYCTDPSNSATCTGSAGAPAYCPTGATQATGSELVTVSYPYSFGKPLIDLSITITGKASMPCGG